MKNIKITKKMFYLTILLLVINSFIFLYDKIAGFVVLGYGVVFYFPLVFVIILVDRFYFKNKNPLFFMLIILICIFIFILYLLSKSYFESIFSLM